MRQPKPCGEKCEIFSRVVGYFRNISNWNVGKKQEFDDRRTFSVGGERRRKQDEKNIGN